jgi:hypothetical protein
MDFFLTIAKKPLDAQVLLDPFEEQLDLPGAFVQGGNGQRRQARVVDQEDQSLLGLKILEPDTAKVFGLVLGDFVPFQYNGLIADKTAAIAYFGRLPAIGVHVALGSGYKDREPPRSLSLGNYTGMGKRVSNRHQIKLASRQRQYWHSLRINPV